MCILDSFRRVSTKTDQARPRALARVAAYFQVKLVPVLAKGSRATVGAKMYGWRVLAVVLLLVGCGSSGGGSPKGAGGTATGGNMAMGGSGPGGAGGSGGASASGGAGGAPLACSGLSSTAPAQLLYQLASGASWYLAGSDNQGILVAVDVNKAIRVVSATPGGTADVLLDETTYQASWSFDPTSVVALRRSDGVDVLVSDDSFVVLVRKQGSSVRVVQLAQTNDSDLTAMALTAGSSGTLVVFQQGHDTYGTNQKITAVDVDPLIAAAGATPANISIAQQVSGMAQANRSFPAPTGALAVATPTQIWLTVERLNATTDCQDTGQTAACTGGSPAVSWLDCTWHLDAFKLGSGADLQSAPTATVDSEVVTHQTCGSSMPVNTGSTAAYTPTVDPATGQLGLALDYAPTQTSSGLQFTLLGPSGTPLFGNLNEVAPAGGPGGLWALVRGGHFFYCYGSSLEAFSCWSASSSGLTSFTVPFDQIARGAVQTPTSVGVVEGLYIENGVSDGSAWYQPLDCAP